MADRLSQEDKDWITSLPEREREVVVETLLAFPQAVFVDRLRAPQPEQLSLVADTPHARVGDPSTSKRAAAQIEAEEGTTSRMLPGTTKHLALLTIFQSPRSTAVEVERISGKRGIWKRVSDLKRADLIRKTGERFDPLTKQTGDVWEINERGARVLAQLDAGKSVQL